jgi:hypothetical protein
VCVCVCACVCTVTTALYDEYIMHFDFDLVNICTIMTILCACVI